MDDITKLFLLMIDKAYLEERISKCGKFERVNLECALRKVNSLIAKLSV